MIKLSVAVMSDMMKAGDLVLNGRFEVSIEDMIAFVEVSYRRSHVVVESFRKGQA